MQKLIIPVLICFTFCSCKTEQVYFNATVSAPVTIPVGVKKIGIINRSVISDSNNVRKALDNVLSIKSASLDVECSNESVRGLRDGLVQGNVFQSVTFLDSVKISNSFPGSFPSPLSWDKIREICQKYNVDVLFALEMFHTDTKVSVLPAGIQSSAGVRTTVNTGWRIYDPQNRLIMDEYTLYNGLSFGGSVFNPVSSAGALMDHKDAVKGVSYRLGQSYSSRVFPYTIRVCRDFYIKGTDNFKVARRMADAGDWNKAADLWNKETQNTNPKIRARAFYDMAIISEMNGDIDKAIDWAKQSYETGGKRMALIYLNMLKDHKADNDVLKSQAPAQ